MTSSFFETAEQRLPGSPCRNSGAAVTTRTFSSLAEQKCRSIPSSPAPPPGHSEGSWTNSTQCCRAQPTPWLPPWIREGNHVLYSHPVRHRAFGSDARYVWLEPSLRPLAAKAKPVR